VYGYGAGTAAALRAITGELADRFPERASAVRSLVIAVLVGQHSLLLGLPRSQAPSCLRHRLSQR
jgi:MoxR-like ATPase